MRRITAGLFISLDGVVDPFVANHVEGGIADAAHAGAAAVLITLDTPGGSALTVTFKLDRTARTRKALTRLHKVSKATMAIRTASRDRAGNSRITTTSLVLKR